MHPGSVFLLTYWTVLIAELAGDKSLYTIASLTLRYSWRCIFVGLAAGFASKMLVAVLLGRALSQIPIRWLAVVSAVSLLTTAALLWRRQEAATVTGWRGAGAAVSFGSIFFSEWADFGQIAAAMVTAQYHSPFESWLGGTLAMMTKGALALTIGVKLREYLPAAGLRSLATACCVALAAVALVEAVL